MGDELKLIWHCPRCHCISSRLHECDDAVPYALHCLRCLTMVDASQYEMKVWRMSILMSRSSGSFSRVVKWCEMSISLNTLASRLKCTPSSCLPGLSFWSSTKTARLWLIGFRIRGQIWQDSDSHGKWRWPASSEVDKLRDFCREEAHCGMHSQMAGMKNFPIARCL